MSQKGRSGPGRQRKQSTRDRQLTVVPPPEPECDCAACSGEDINSEQLIDELLTGAGDLLTGTDPLDAEIVAAGLVGFGDEAGEGFTEALIEAFIPGFEQRATAEATGMLLALGSVAPGRAAGEAAAAAERLIKAGVPAPSWASELAEPVVVGECRVFEDEAGAGAVLIATFVRAGRAHALVLDVDHTECGEAEYLALVPADQLPKVVASIREDARESGARLNDVPLSPTEFRRRAEDALDIRAAHDEADYLTPFDADMDWPAAIGPGGPDVGRPGGGVADGGLADRDDMSDEDDPESAFAALLPLLRARLAVMPASDRPESTHRHDSAVIDVADIMTRLLGNAGGRGTAKGRAAGRKLPPKRKKSDGPAPVFQVKISLRGAKPPIWRRLEVPGDITLFRLHQVVQLSFAWEDYHMYAFETPYGDFGRRADAELGHRSAKTATLEQVAAGVGDRIVYTYDFGDGWEHEILVEKMFERDASTIYPRCTGGRRAAPPEDCGGVWGYADLVEILADPKHPEHADRLEWLGLETAADFDPARFDPKAVSQRISGLR